MELIPILSTIILVATISTFFLAIGAYFLYKVREARGQKAAAVVPSTVKAELIAPIEIAASLTKEQARSVPQPLYSEHSPTQYQPSSEPSRLTLSGQPRQFAEQESPSAKNYQAPKSKSGSRYLKYTTEGYESVTNKKDEKNNGTLRWN